MQMPSPTAQHERLEAFVGRWVGVETLHPSPWSPERRDAMGRFSSRIAVDGMFLVTDYEQERDGEVVFRGHGVYGWDGERQRYTMFWFDSMGMSPNRTFGVWDGDTLTFSNHGEHGHSRYIYTFATGDRFRFRIESSQDGEQWSTMMDGEYTRQ